MTTATAKHACARCGKTMHECARCGKKSTVDRMTYSRFTRNRYCQDTTACDRRFLRRRHAEKTT